MHYERIHELSSRHVAELHELYRSEWWTSDRTAADIEVMLANSSFVFGLVTEADHLVGFARVLSDRVYKAVIFDVIVSAEHRGEGLGDELMQWILAHPELERVRHFELYCLPEMQPFYARFGFGGELGSVAMMRRELTNSQD